MLADVDLVADLRAGRVQAAAAAARAAPAARVPARELCAARRAAQRAQRRFRDRLCKPRHSSIMSQSHNR